MSDININGIPNMGFAGAGGGYFGGNAGLGIPAMGAAGDFGASKFSQPLYNSIFNNFGQQTDYYSALAAAYGRATGGFAAPGWYDQPAPAAPQAPPQQVSVASSPFDTGSAGAFPYANIGGLKAGGGYWQDPNAAPAGAFDPFTPGYGGQGAGMGSLFDQGGGQPAANPYAQMYRMPDANPSYFSPGAFAGDQGNFGLPAPRSGSLPGDIGFSRQPSYPNLGYNPGMQNWFANPAMGGNQFQNAFANFPNSATPSQYTYQPYTNTQGQTFQPNMPQGFAPLYGADTPQGALPLNWNSSFGPGNSAQPGG
jgi:hypothetical protein